MILLLDGSRKPALQQRQKVHFPLQLVITFGMSYFIINTDC